MEQGHELKADLRRVENWSEFTWWETVAEPYQSFTTAQRGSKGELFF